MIGTKSCMFSDVNQETTECEFKSGLPLDKCQSIRTLWEQRLSWIELLFQMWSKEKELEMFVSMNFVNKTHMTPGSLTPTTADSPRIVKATEICVLTGWGLIRDTILRAGNPLRGTGRVNKWEIASSLNKPSSEREQHYTLGPLLDRLNRHPLQCPKKV